MSNFARSISWCLAMLIAFSASAAHAWSEDGHRIVGAIAWQYTSPQTRARLHALLDEPGYETLAEAAAWADVFAKQDPRFEDMKRLHYVNVLPTATAYDEARDCPAGCVVTAIAHYSARLLPVGQGGAKLKNERREALYWVAHFVGDVHQPLHVAHPDGKGGNQTFVDFFGQRRRLHVVWDALLIERSYAHFLPIKADAEDRASAWPTLAFALWREISPEARQGYASELSPVAWANESLELAQKRAFLSDGALYDEARFASDYAAAKLQLEKAGVRLGALLNRTLGA